MTINSYSDFQPRSHTMKRPAAKRISETLSRKCSTPSIDALAQISQTVSGISSTPGLERQRRSNPAPSGRQFRIGRRDSYQIERDGPGKQGIGESGRQELPPELSPAGRAWGRRRVVLPHRISMGIRLPRIRQARVAGGRAPSESPAWRGDPGPMPLGQCGRAVSLR